MLTSKLPPQKGPAERGHLKKRPNSSKSVKTNFDMFRQFCAQGKNREKLPKSLKNNFRHFSTTHPFSGPFWESLTLKLLLLSAAQRIKLKESLRKAPAGDPDQKICLLVRVARLQNETAPGKKAPLNQALRLICIQTSLHTSQIRSQCVPVRVWKRFPTGPPSAVTSLAIMPVHEIPVKVKRMNKGQEDVQLEGSTPTPVFLTSWDETQAMVRAKVRPKLRPP